MKPKAVIFDMDGVLIDARDWHFRALNEALSYFGAEISTAEHETTFNGLPTRVKLSMLSDFGRLPQNVHSAVEKVKQERTLREAANLCFPNVDHLVMLGWLKANGYRLAVATNSVRESSEAMLKFAGVFPLLDTLVTNQDVMRGKPEPEIYLKACANLGIQPGEALVIEDHTIGVQAAIAAGCRVHQIDGPEDLNLNLLLRLLAELER